MKKAELLACALGILVGAAATTFVLPDAHEHYGEHPIADPFDSEYHVHADFLVYIGDRSLDLSGDEYMTTAAQMLSDDVHLHDNNGDVEHIHAEAVPFVAFLDTIGVTVTASCITEKDGTESCTDDNTVLQLFVNGEDRSDELLTYVPEDEDRVLLYLGDQANENITSYLEAIPDDACYYSGTCPERGTAPPESCGLTCEL